MKTIILAAALLLSGCIFSQQPCTAPVAVLVTSAGNKPYPADKILFVGKKTRKTISGITDAAGKFRINLPCGDTYDIKVASVGEEMEYNTLAIPSLEKDEAFEDMWLHIVYELPEEFTLKNLHFETAKATIQPSGHASLDQVADFLKRKPAITVEIAGHTDSDGDNEANRLLSQQRADAVRTYLISKGVPAKQLKATGYGETQPIADNTTSSGKQQNRRTEIRLLSK